MGIVSSFRKVVRIKHMQKKGEEGGGGVGWGEVLAPIVNKQQLVGLLN